MTKAQRDQRNTVCSVLTHGGGTRLTLLSTRPVGELRLRDLKIVLKIVEILKKDEEDATDEPRSVAE